MTKTLAPIGTLVYIDNTGTQAPPGDLAMNAKQITSRLGRPVDNSGAIFLTNRRTQNSLSDEIQAGLDRMSGHGDITVVVVGDIGEAEQIKINEHFSEVEIVFATELKKVAVLFGWGDFSPELRGSMQDKLHELHQLDDNIVVQGMVFGTLSRLAGMDTPENFHRSLDTILEMYTTAKANFDIVACYVVSDIAAEKFEELTADLRERFDAPITLVNPLELVA